MEIDSFQQQASLTDRHPGQDANALLIPLLGLAGEAGTLLSEYKKYLRDGSAHERFRIQVREELGDLLWYTANLATKFGFSMADIAANNLQKTRGRWVLSAPAQSMALDDSFPPSEQLPRRFRYLLEERIIDGRKKLVVLDANGSAIGDPLTDNAYQEDGYRFHDVLHLAFAAMLGWSPVFRRLLKRKRKSQPEVDEVEDGARAAIIEELISAIVFEYAARHRFLHGTDTVDWEVLRVAKRLTQNLEVSSRTEAQWERAIVAGFKSWRSVLDAGGGIVYGDLTTPEFRYIDKSLSSE